MHPRISVHSISFAGASLPELADLWRQADARRVSVSSDLLLATGGPAAAREALAAGDYRLETITHGFVAGGHLERCEKTWEEARARLRRLIRTASSLGAKSIYMLTGGHGALTWEEAADNFRDALGPCVAEAADAGIPLLIENAPALYADMHIAHTLRDTVQLAELAGIGVCIDLFSCWTEAGLRQTIERAMPRCHVVQVSDYVYGDRSLPARAVPGDGAIPLERLLGWMLEAGYRGVFDLELIGPRIDMGGRVAGVRRAADFVGRILESLGA